MGTAVQAQTAFILKAYRTQRCIQGRGRQGLLELQLAGKIRAQARVELQAPPLESLAVVGLVVEQAVAATTLVVATAVPQGLAALAAAAAVRRGAQTHLRKRSRSQAVQEGQQALLLVALAVEAVEPLYFMQAV